MKRRHFVTSMGAVAGGLVVAGCTEQLGSDPAEDEEFFDLEGGVGEKAGEGGLKITEQRLFRTEAGFGVMGVVKNTSQDTYTFVQVRATLADENDDPITTFNESIGRNLGLKSVDTEAISELGPGEIWKFTVFFEDVKVENVASYRLIVSGEVA